MEGCTSAPGHSRWRSWAVVHTVLKAWGFESSPVQLMWPHMEGLSTFLFLLSTFTSRFFLSGNKLTPHQSSFSPSPGALWGRDTRFSLSPTWRANNTRHTYTHLSHGSPPGAAMDSAAALRRFLGSLQVCLKGQFINVWYRNHLGCSLNSRTLSLLQTWRGTARGSAFQQAFLVTLGTPQLRSQLRLAYCR